jgi:flagellar basal-body rod protein FlgC
MDYRSAFQISASGMTVEKTRLDVTAVNLANVHSTRSADGTLFRPMRVVSQQSAASFSSTMASMGTVSLGGSEVASIEEAASSPRAVYEPGHPQADEKGFVQYPGVDQVGEMVTLMTAVRSYEANVIAMNAAKTMAAKALDIGGAA